LPAGRVYYLRLFAISILIVVAALLGLLFGVRMESAVTATGVLQAREQQTLRAATAGLVTLGWYEGTWEEKGEPLVFRVDDRGHGMTDPATAPAQPIRDYLLPDGRSIKSAVRHFHPLVVGDYLWPGQPLASVRHEVTLPDGTERLAVRVPPERAAWQVLKIYTEPDATLAAGAEIAIVAPVDPVSHEPVAVLARLEIPEEAGEELTVGQTVRLSSNVFNAHRYGSAEATLLSIDPLVETHADGKRYFHASAAITQCPFPLRLGSGVSASIVVGRKTVFHIIVEH
jgi:hypothetical protein